MFKLKILQIASNCSHYYWKQVPWCVANSILACSYIATKVNMLGHTGSEPECASQLYTLVDNFNLHACIHRHSEIKKYNGWKTRYLKFVMAECTNLKSRHISITIVKRSGQQHLTAFKQHVKCLPSTRQYRVVIPCVKYQICCNKLHEGQ